MIKVFENLFVGNDEDCNSMMNEGWAVIHACKIHCHQKAVSYKGNLKSTHPNYLIYERYNHLFLNMVDMEQELLPLYTNPIMKAAMSFIDKHISDKKVLIHCNQGISRSPSIALLYLARIEKIANDTFNNAVIDFKKKYPLYNPGKGILMYMNKNWRTIIK
ncbi:MAG: dual specificity protein phosphatase [Bacteroidales bacterium]